MINKISQILKKSPWDDFEEEDNIFTRKRKDKINLDNFQFNFSKNTLILAALAILALWLASGIYEVKEGEQAVVLRFGKLHRVSMPGLNYHIPKPIESVIIEKVNKSRRIEIGYRSSGRNNRNSTISIRDVGSESTMLTGDENVVELNVDIMWHISDLADYLFNVVNPQETVKSVAESAIREIIGNSSIASVLSNQKQEIADKVEKLTQQILDQYKTGVEIEQVKLLKAEPPKEVIQAYRDVQAAKADKEKSINQAESYRNNILPKARGEAAQILQKSEGYKAEVIAKAKGNTSRFNAIYKQYAASREVTKNRLYLEAIEEILKGSDKVIMGGDGMLPHMAVNQQGVLKK